MNAPYTGKITGPYTDSSTNTIYNWLFCDNIGLFKETINQPYSYPWNILLATPADIAGLQSVVADAAVETRARVIACNLLRAHGFTIEKKELLAVIVEVGLEDGLDVLASFKDGTARYINQSGAMVIWDADDDSATTLTQQLFANSIPIIEKIGPWTEARRPHPATGMARISFLVSDGLYFGEAPMNALFTNPLAKHALLTATALMQFLTDKAMATEENS